MKVVTLPTNFDFHRDWSDTKMELHQFWYPRSLKKFFYNILKHFWVILKHFFSIFFTQLDLAGNTFKIVLSHCLKCNYGFENCSKNVSKVFQTDQVVWISPTTRHKPHLKTKTLFFHANAIFSTFVKYSELQRPKRGMRNIFQNNRKIIFQEHDGHEIRNFSKIVSKWPSDAEYCIFSIGNRLRMSKRVLEQFIMS